MISPSQGSIQGGTVLTISGQFFDQTDSPVRVLVGGQACDILNVTENSICCKTPPKPEVLRTVYPGGRGLKLEVWNNSRPVHLEEILEYNEKTPGYMGASWVDSTSYIWPMEQDTFVARFSGFLVAPDSDVYRFYIKGDDRYAIYFSQTGHPKDKIITNETENESVYRGNNWPGESKIRIQRIQAASPPLSGSFDIQAYGHILKGLPAMVSAVDLQFALQSVEEVGRVSVTREGTCAGYSWNIKWRSTCGKQNLLQINDSNIIGEKANMTVTKIKEGGLFRQRILGDLLRTPSQQPQVEVYVNGIPAKCSGDCGFTWDPMATPLVWAINPSQGTYEESTILTISGSGFSPNSTISVSVGPMGCSLLSVVENEIKCQILNGSSGHFPVAVSVADVGLARNVEGQTFHFTYQNRISHIWPASGSLAGGTLLSVSGFGFNENSKVLVGNETCNVIEGDLNKITCRTPKRIEGTVDISVITNGFQATAKDAYSYNCLQTPVITDFSPKVRTIQGEVNLTIKGYNFGNEITQNVEVYVGGKPCQIFQWNFTYIRCLLPKLSPGKHDIYVEVRNWGFASTRDKLNASIQYTLEVTAMFPQRGSLYGGTEITIMGLGFSTIPTENTVLLGSFPCDVISSSENVIKCILHSTGNTFRITSIGEDSGISQHLYVVNYGT
ncbi:fibrocystin-L-like [Leptonychotes weddellii]|uniref:Fibrocystin-L-like n=1 Tax=Leptonychotes weddellii TaxID=9713 RepID=A0A7F8RT90_LEPWE|nr:fibrocystin-L-like [Leptonychotes weddellii]